MSCIGTAGHVDHGKSTLIQALTGIDPDRLAEEKARGMTIDLGFAWLTLPGGREVSIVDVPGHESFIKNMLAGVGGIDLALLIIAADEGIMPQTREHLAILDLLQIHRGIVVLTKKDLVDQEWLAMVHEEVAEQLQTTSLANAPILAVSAYTLEGLGELVATIEQLLSQDDRPLRQGITHLPIDRVFSLTGFGTVVTGTLQGDSLHVGQEVELLPQGLRARIRSLQMHKQQVEEAVAGSRVAANLVGVAKDQLARGTVLTFPGRLETTQLFDARLQLWRDAERTLQHNASVEIFIGTQEIPARIRLLEKEEIEPGGEGWVQVRLSRAGVVLRRERFIVRVPSPSMTIGGGEVIDVQPRYHRRGQREILERLARLEQGSEQELLLSLLTQAKEKREGTGQTRIWAYNSRALAIAAHLPEEVTRQALEPLLREREISQIGNYWFARLVWEEIVSGSRTILEDYHRRYRLRGGMSREEWRTRLQLPSRLVADVLIALEERGELRGNGGEVCLMGFEPRLEEEQARQAEELLREYKQQELNAPPTRQEAETQVGLEIVRMLIECGKLIKVGEQLLFLPETYATVVERIKSYLGEHGKIGVAETRDLLGTTRKYVVPFLEHLDAIKITKRVGDERQLIVK